MSNPPSSSSCLLYSISTGRGKKNWKHAGNTTFRELIRKNVARYIAAPAKTDKTQVVISLVDAIRNRGGRFLKLNDEGRFYDVGDAVARDKVGHSLRDQVSSMGRNKSKSVIHDAKKQANQVHPAAVISRGDSLVSNFTTSSSTVAMADTDSPIPDQQASAAMADMDSPIPDRQMSLAGPAEPADISVVEALSSALWVSDIWTSDMFDASQPMVSRSMFSSSNEEEE